MERREFLKLGVAAGALSVSGRPGEAMAVIDPMAFEPARLEMEPYLHRLDHAMDYISSGSTLRAVAPSLRAQAPDAHDAADDLCKKGIRSILLAGMFRDLSEEGRAHPEMQRRMRDALPEMDESVLGMTRVLASMTDDDHARVRQRLKEDPEAIMRVGGVLDQYASKLELPTKRRVHLRKVMSHIAWRMQRQSPALVIDECVSKVRKLAARHGYSDQLEAAIAAGARGVEPVGSHGTRFAGVEPGTKPAAAPTTQPVAASAAAPEAGAAAQPVAEAQPAAQPVAEAQPTAQPAAPANAPVADPAQPQPKKGEAPRPGSVPIRVGAITLGIGVGVGGLSIALINVLDIVALFGVTLGVLLVLVGLIVMTIGGIIRATQ